MNNDDRVNVFVRDITEAAIFDYYEGVPEYDSKRNTGNALLTRLNLNRHRQSPRRGDARYARSIYTAARFLIRTEVEE